MAENYKPKVMLSSKDGKTYWREVGIATPPDAKGNVKVKLDLIPAVGWDGWLVGFPADKPEEKDKSW